MKKPCIIGDMVFSCIDGDYECLFYVVKPMYKITGKYLFFSEDRNLLKKIAIQEIKQNGFPCAKVNLKSSKVGRDYVLCLYYKDDSRKKELAEKYLSFPNVRYRYWKSDEDTRNRKYSEEFLRNLEDNKVED